MEKLQRYLNLPTFNEAMAKIAKLGDKKGWGKEIGTKIYYGMIELAEGGDAWKHRGDPEYLKNELGITIDELPEYIGEELIDTMFYCLHAFYCLGLTDADAMFEYKLNKNIKRNRIYVGDEL